MKGKILMIGAIVVIAMLVLFAWGTGIGGTPYWETETEFGMWQQELYVVFADGTNQSLKLIDEGRTLPFTVKYNNAVVTKMGIKITAAISGSGFTGAELKFTGFGVTREIRNAAGVLKKTYNSMRPDGTLQKQMGSSDNILTTEFNLDATINQNPSTYPTGLYMVKFIPMGSVKYRGYPDGGDFVSASLPPLRFATITVTQTAATIVVTLGSELTAS